MFHTAEKILLSRFPAFELVGSTATSSSVQYIYFISLYFVSNIMGKRKEISNSEPEAHSDVSATRYSNAEKMEQNCMLLSTTYGLNSSYTKKIHVGLQSSINDEDFDFLPCVKLSSNGAEGIWLNMLEWQQFQENLPRMGEYLDGDNIIQNPITIGKIIINFITAYGAKALLLTYRENEQKDVPSKNISATEETSHTSKKRKTYAVAIAMQKTTFLGLQNVIECVNANVNQLNSIANSANECAKYLINEIQINLPVKGYIESDIIKLAFKANCQDIQQNVRIQLKDLTFLDAYFEIIFLELIALYFNQIVRKIKMHRKL